MIFTTQNRGIQSQAGWWMIEIAISMMVGVIITTITIIMMQAMIKLPTNTSQVQNLIGLEQLRFHLAQAYDIQTYPDQLEYEYHGEGYELRLINQRLIQSPGTYIFMIELDELEFIMEDQALWMKWQSHGKTYQYWLAWV
jgi:hypothetical protein